MTNLEREMAEGVKLLGDLDVDSVMGFVSKIKPPVLIAAMGSSFYMPTGRAQAVINKLSKHPDVRFILASEGYNINPNSFNSLVLMSNSGQTREVLALSELFPREKIFSVTSNLDSPLGRASGSTYLLQSGEERAVAATKSIIEQSIVLEMLMEHLSGEYKYQGPELKAISRAMKLNLHCKVDPRLLVLISGARTIYFTGGSFGIGEEIALKFNELAKKKTKYIPGTQILHGSEEVIEKGDVIFVLFADRYFKYRDRFIQMREKTGCYLFSFGENNVFDRDELKISIAKGYKPYCILAYFWNILTEFALTKGFSLDRGEKINKVGVAAK